MWTVAKSAPLLALLTFGVLVAGAPAAEPKKAASGHAHAAPARAAKPLRLLDIMRASVEIPADGIWAAEGNDKLTDEDWQLADQDAVNLIVASDRISRPGSGPKDAKWVAANDWKKWVKEMANTSMHLRAAIKATDPKAMAAAADRLQEICEACHTKYRPQTPSDGNTRYPFYPKRELIR